MKNEEQLKIEVATCVRLLEYLGLIDFSGHVSVRIPGTDTMLINAWGGKASPEKVTPADIVKADLYGNPLKEGDQLPSEKHIHASIYRHRPDVLAVAHTHPPVTTALSAAGIEYVPVMHHGAIFQAGVSVYDDASHVNTKEKGDAVAATLGKLRATLIRGHGAVVVAESVKGVFFGSVYLEDNARKLSDVYKMGREPIVLRPDENEACGRIWSENQFHKVWNYYQEKSGVRFD